MSISLPNRAIAAGLALAVALWLGGTALLVTPAQAQTIEELQAQIAALQAQLDALTGGGSSTGCYAFTRDLYNGVGSGDDVTALQDYLTGTGHFTFSGGSTGYFGPITQAAVSAWQAANGVAPTAGYFGPLSRAKYNSVCTPGDGGDDGDDGGGDLEGEEGNFKNFEVLGDPSAETVYESDDQQVLGWKFEAQDSDLRTERVRVRFDATGTSDNKPWKWLDEVCLWHGDDEVACEDADSKGDWSEATTNIYEKTFSGLKEVTREGDESEFFVAVKTPASIDSVMDGDTVHVSLEANGLRAEDAAGEDLTGHTAQLRETFTFDTDPSGKLELTLDSDDNPARVVEVDATNNTADVVLLTWEMETKEGPVMITDLAVDISSANSSTGDVGEQLASVDLYRDGSKVKTESVASTAVDSSITFDNIDQETDIGTEEWMVKGKVKNIDVTTFQEGDAVVLDIDNADVTAEASNGDTVTPTGGTITGVSTSLKEKNPSIKIIAVQPQQNHLIQGLRNFQESAKPDLFLKRETVIDDWITISNEEAFCAVKDVFQQDRLLVSPSSGAVYAAMKKYKIEDGCVVGIFADDGRKFKSLYSEQNIFSNQEFDEALNMAQHMSKIAYMK